MALASVGVYSYRLYGNLPPLQIPVSSETEFEGICCFATGLQSFFVQLPNYGPQRDRLQTLLNETYNKFTEEEFVLINGQKNELCVAKFDGEWYRACFLELVTSDMAKVKFIDYGNIDEVLMAEVKLMDRRFVELPAQAVECCAASTFFVSPELLNEKLAFAHLWLQMLTDDAEPVLKVFIKIDHNGRRMALQDFFTLIQTANARLPSAVSVAPASLAQHSSASAWSPPQQQFPARPSFDGFLTTGSSVPNSALVHPGANFGSEYFANVGPPTRQQQNNLESSPESPFLYREDVTEAQSPFLPPLTYAAPSVSLPRSVPMPSGLATAQHSSSLFDGPPTIGRAAASALKTPSAQSSVGATNFYGAVPRKNSQGVSTNDSRHVSDDGLTPNAFQSMASNMNHLSLNQANASIPATQGQVQAYGGQNSAPRVSQFGQQQQQLNITSSHVQGSIGSAALISSGNASAGASWTPGGNDMLASNGSVLSHDSNSMSSNGYVQQNLQNESVAQAAATTTAPKLTFAQIYAKCGNPSASLGTQPVVQETESLNCVGFKPSTDVYSALLSRKAPENVQKFINDTIRKDARMIVYEYGTSRRMNVSIKQVDRSGPHGGEVFVNEVQINGRQFPKAAAFNKKESEKKAAENAIEVLLAEKLLVENSVSSLP